ncbi:recombinase family protein [Candidatus Latescibacterota bacterium]
MNAIEYIRVSTDEQAGHGVSLDNQKAKIRAYAEVKEVELIEIVEDAGISAKNLNRPGVQRVLDIAKSKKVDAVIVYKLDRMFRNTIDALETTKLFDRWCGVVIACIMAGFLLLERSMKAPAGTGPDLCGGGCM